MGVPGDGCARGEVGSTPRASPTLTPIPTKELWSKSAPAAAKASPNPAAAAPEFPLAAGGLLESHVAEYQTIIYIYINFFFF